MRQPVSRQPASQPVPPAWAGAAAFAPGAGAAGVFLSASVHAAWHSLHRNLPVLRLSELSSATACAAHSARSQFRQVVTEALPHGFFLNSPVSMTQGSAMFFSLPS